MTKREELESELHRAIERAAGWRGLLDHPGWVRYKSMADEQIRLRHATICLTPLESFGKSLEQEFMKGEAAGLTLALTLVETQHEMARLDVERLTTAIEMETTNETAAKQPDGRSRVENDDFSRE